MRSIARSSVSLGMSCLIFVGTAPLASQATSQPRPMRSVTLIELPSAPDGKRAMVYRRITGEDRDVIGLAPEADGRDLRTALRVLDALYAQFGDSLGKDIAAGVRLQAIGTEPSNATDDAFVQQLRGSPQKQVNGFGTPRALKIDVPKKKLRRRY